MSQMWHDAWAWNVHGMAVSRLARRREKGKAGAFVFIFFDILRRISHKVKDVFLSRESGGILYRVWHCGAKCSCRVVLVGHITPHTLH